MVVETGKISLKDLTFDCIIGTLPFEREKEQPIVLNISIWLDFTQAARNDDLVHSIDYAQLSDNLKEFIRGAKFQPLTTSQQCFPTHGIAKNTTSPFSTTNTASDSIETRKSILSRPGKYLFPSAKYSIPLSFRT